MIKRYLRFFILIIGYCTISGALSGQDTVGTLYSIKFPDFKTHLSKQTKATLNNIAKVMRDRPSFYCTITGYCIAENPRSNQASWDRIDKIIDRLVKKKGINADRFIFKNGGEGNNCNEINIAFTEEMTEIVPAPHPNLRRKNE